MVRVPIIQESKATGATKALYDDVEQMFGLSFVPDVFKLLSTRPDLLRPMVDQYRAMFHRGVLPRDIKELVATVVSVTNSCHY